MYGYIFKPVWFDIGGFNAAPTQNMSYNGQDTAEIVT